MKNKMKFWYAAAFVLAAAVSMRPSSITQPSGSTTAGVFASLPSKSSTGQAYITTDAPYTFVANGSGGWQPIVPGSNGGAVTLPVTSGYSWANQPAGAAVTDTHGGEILSIPNTVSGDDLATRTAMAVPTAPWSVMAAFQLTPYAISFTNSGVYAFNSTSGKGVICGVGGGSIGLQAVYQRWNTFTSIDANTAVFAYGHSSGITWIKMLNDGTNINCFESSSGGQVWNKYFSEPLSSWYTGSIVTSVGYGYDIANSNTLSGSLWLVHWLQGTN